MYTLYIWNVVLFTRYDYHLVLRVLSHPFPTRRSSDLCSRCTSQSRKVRRRALPTAWSMCGSRPRIPTVSPAASPSLRKRPPKPIQRWAFLQGVQLELQQSPRRRCRLGRRTAFSPVRCTTVTDNAIHSEYTPTSIPHKP